MSNTKKDDLPYMPFYIGDWFKATDVQSLNYEMKGLWFEMLCYMWESKERGCLLYTMEELSRLLRLPEDLLKQKLDHLLSKGICFAREGDGAICNRRMIKDQNIREIRKESGSLGGKSSFAQRFAQAKTTANADIDNDIVNENEDKGIIQWKVEFNRIWELYPSKTGRKAAEKHFFASVKTKADLTNIETAVTNYKQSKRVRRNFILNGSTWFNNWQDWIIMPPTEVYCELCKSTGKFISDTGYESICYKCPDGKRLK